MAYTIEDIVTPLGTGLRVQKGNDWFFQQVRSDGVMVRRYSSEGLCKGIASILNFDYEKYCLLADRVQHVFGKEVPTNPGWFIDVIGRKESSTQDMVTIVPTRQFSQMMSGYISEKRRMLSCISGIVQSSAILGLTATGMTTYGVEPGSVGKIFFGFGYMYGLFGTIAEVLMRIGYELEFGPLSFIGSFAAKSWYTRKLKDPTYLVNKFREENERLMNLARNPASA